MADMTPQRLEQIVREFTVARTTNLGIEVTTPIIYPNGDAVAVVVVPEEGGYTVHDAGFGAMNLSASGIAINSDLRKKFARIAQQYGCEFTGSRMQRRCSAEQVPVATVMVSNASRCVGDQVLEVRAQREKDFRFVVAERLNEIVGARLRNNQQVRGKARSYHIPHVILDAAQSRPLAYIVPLSGRSQVLSHVGEFFDIRNADAVPCDSILDDGGDFKPEDRELLREFGDVIPFLQVNSRFNQMLRV